MSQFRPALGPPTSGIQRWMTLQMSLPYQVYPDGDLRQISPCLFLIITPLFSSYSKKKKILGKKSHVPFSFKILVMGHYRFPSILKTHLNRLETGIVSLTWRFHRPIMVKATAAMLTRSIGYGDFTRAISGIWGADSSRYEEGGGR